MEEEKDGKLEFLDTVNVITRHPKYSALTVSTIVGSCALNTLKSKTERTLRTKKSKTHF